jgi:signal peptidase I
MIKLTLLLCWVATCTALPLVSRLSAAFWNPAHTEARFITFSYVGALLVKACALDTRVIVSDSMQPTLVAGDMVLVDKLGHHISREVSKHGIIVFRPPEACWQALDPRQFRTRLGKRGNSVVYHTLELKNLMGTLTCWSSSFSGKSPGDFTKRVAAVAGDSAQCLADGSFYVNNKLVFSAATTSRYWLYAKYSIKTYYGETHHTQMLIVAGARDSNRIS